MRSRRREFGRATGTYRPSKLGRVGAFLFQCDLMPLLLSIAIAAFGLAAEGPLPNFSGSWKQSNEQCSPQRTGEVTLKIEHRDPELVVETTSKGRAARHALQRYTTDGVESKSIGADGDEFHSIVVWKDGSLAFDIVEIEDGKRLKSTEIWRLIDGGKTLRRVRRTDKAGEQTLVYLRTQ